MLTYGHTAQYGYAHTSCLLQDRFNSGLTGSTCSLTALLSASAASFKETLLDAILARTTVRNPTKPLLTLALRPSSLAKDSIHTRHVGSNARKRIELIIKCVLNANDYTISSTDYWL